MKKNLIFKCCIVLMICVLVCGLFFGCSGSGGYKVVKSVTFISGGTSKTISSRGSHRLYSPTIITQEEYENRPKGRDNFEQYGVNLKEVYEKNKGKTEVTFVAESLKGYWYDTYFGGFTGKTRYYSEAKYQDSYCYFVYVKVINDTTIKIKTHEGETTYTVTSYSIVDL